jgi:SPX domain protein involved in polyphosphate accumulation
MISIWKIDKYHNVNVMVQRIGYDGFQWIIIRHGKFYQGWIKVKPKWWKWFLRDPYTRMQKENIIKWATVAYQTTINTLEKGEQLKKEDNIEKNKKCQKRNTKKN